MKEFLFKFFFEKCVIKNKKTNLILKFKNEKKDNFLMFTQLASQRPNGTHTCSL